MKNDERIISGLLSCATIKGAAEYAGVSERTVYSRLSNPDFMKKLAAERHQLFKAHTTTLQGQIGKSIQTMVEIRDNEKTPPQIRLNASAELIRNGLKMIELIDIVDRMDSLEQKLEGIK
ncbi:MAG: hypothetical protein IJX37_01430 [Oscillospiraceae bacterium]|nr:hypothetical protein [Oscillospiraceae bacterium]